MKIKVGNYYKNGMNQICFVFGHDTGDFIFLRYSSHKFFKGYVDKKGRYRHVSSFANSLDLIEDLGCNNLLRLVYEDYLG